MIARPVHGARRLPIHRFEKPDPAALKVEKQSSVHLLLGFLINKDHGSWAKLVDVTSMEAKIEPSAVAFKSKGPAKR